MIIFFEDIEVGNYLYIKSHRRASCLAVLSLLIFVLFPTELVIAQTTNPESIIGKPSLQRSKSTKKTQTKKSSKHLIACYHPFVSDLVVSDSEGTPRNFIVVAKVDDQESSILRYVYSVSGGKVIGNGPTVKWDTMGLKPGRYWLNAGVDDGCGVCGATKTFFVDIR